MKTSTAAALAAAATVGVYWGALSAGFVGDDFMILHRLREGGSLLRFFHGEFFDYYRPLGFVAHAIDYRLAGARAAPFHATNLLLHVGSTILVLLIGRALAPRTAAGPLAAFLFALHASNHEAVVWISARFDLLATFFSLLAIWLLVRRDAAAARGRMAALENRDPIPWVAALAFLGALLSKESAVALPIAAAGDTVFRQRASARETIVRLAPWIAALAIYSALRHVGGGVSTIGGTGKLPKLASFAAILLVLVVLAGDRWTRLRTWLQTHGTLAAAAAAVALAALAAVAARTGGTGLAADKLAVGGFAVFNLVSPVIDLFDVPFYLAPGTAAYWASGAVAIAGAGLLVALGWRRLLGDARLWFLAAFLVATLLPISALTEGTRYLYLPSAALALFVGVAIAELPTPSRTAGITLLAVMTAVSAWQVMRKVRDWQWAGRLTADGARLVDAALALSCGEGHVVFLTEPVALRATYTHFLYETFELPRGCMPARFDVLARLQRIDSPIAAHWQGDRDIVLVAPAYRDNLSLSPDLRNFSVPLRLSAPVTVDTPLGTVRAEHDGDAERVTLTLAPGLDPRHIHFFYYSGGAMHRLD